MIAISVLNSSNSLHIPTSRGPQIFSMDYYHRLTEAQLIKLQWAHLDSCSDLPPRLGFATGSTEWQTDFRGNVLSLGWDWRQTQDGTISIDPEAGVRTNILVRDDRGYDLSPSQSQIRLISAIRLLDWTHFVTEIQVRQC